MVDPMSSVFRPVAKCGKGSPVAEVVDLLKDALAKAQAGQIRSVVIAVDHDGGRGDFGMAWSGARLSTLVAELEKAKLTVVTRMLTEDDDEPEADQDPPPAS
jgi:hypothetical protein